MVSDESNMAIRRIESALARIEAATAGVRGDSVQHRDAVELRSRHEMLRRHTRAALIDLETLIAHEKTGGQP